MKSKGPNLSFPTTSSACAAAFASGATATNANDRRKGKGGDNVDTDALARAMFAEYKRQLPLAKAWLKAKGYPDDIDPKIVAASGAFRQVVGRLPTESELADICLMAFPNSPSSNRLRALAADETSTAGLASGADTRAVYEVVTALQQRFPGCSSPCELTRVRSFYAALVVHKAVGALQNLQDEDDVHAAAALLAAWSLCKSEPPQERVLELLVKAFPEHPFAVMKRS